LAVGRRTLSEINRLNLCHRARELGEKAKHRLVEKIASSPKVKDVRGQALMMGVEFHESGFGAKIMDRLRKAGVIALPSGRDGNVLSLSPALNIPENVLFEGIDRLAQCL
jgi:4-aminobutyrate aminotransferase-like enzyme